MSRSATFAGWLRQQQLRDDSTGWLGRAVVKCRASGCLPPFLNAAALRVHLEDRHPEALPNGLMHVDRAAAQYAQSLSRIPQTSRQGGGDAS